MRAYAFAQASIAKSEAGFHVILYFQTLTQTNHYGYAQYLHSFEAKKLPTTSKNAKATAQKAVSKASVTPNTENAKAAAAGAALQKATPEVNAMPWLHQTPYIVRHCSTIRPHISCVTAVPSDPIYRACTIRPHISCVTAVPSDPIYRASLQYPNSQVACSFSLSSFSPKLSSVTFPTLDAHPYAYSLDAHP